MPKKLNIFSFAKFQAVMFALLGLLVGIIYSFGGFILDSIVTLGWMSPDDASTPGLSFGTLLTFGALVGMPIIGAIVGLIAGAIEAILYNLYVQVFGGIDIDFKE